MKKMSLDVLMRIDLVCMGNCLVKRPKRKKKKRKKKKEGDAAEGGRLGWGENGAAENLQRSFKGLKDIDA